MTTTAHQLTPEQIDKLICVYEHQQDLADAAQAAADELAQGLINVVQQHGTRPETAAQSMRLQGVHSEATVTIGVTRSLHETSIDQLREYMKSQNQKPKLSVKAVKPVAPKKPRGKVAA